MATHTISGLILAGVGLWLTWSIRKNIDWNMWQGWPWPIFIFLIFPGLLYAFG
jgi:hypothetical protein